MTARTEECCCHLIHQAASLDEIYHCISASHVRDTFECIHKLCSCQTYHFRFIWGSDLFKAVIYMIEAVDLSLHPLSEFRPYLLQKMKLLAKSFMADIFACALGKRPCQMSRFSFEDLMDILLHLFPGWPLAYAFFNIYRFNVIVQEELQSCSGNQRTYSDLETVRDMLSFMAEAFHVPIMAELMLHSGCRTT